MLEKNIEAKLRDKVKELGGRAYKFVSPGNAGVPDRLVVLPKGKIGFAELKRLGEEPRRLQEKQMLFLKRLGFIVETIDSIEGIDLFLEKLRGNKDGKANI